MAEVTTRTIAHMAGVSPAAVCFALNGKKGISEEKRRQILEIAERLNYRPAARKEAGGLRIAVIFRNFLPTLDKQFYSELNTSMARLCDDPSISMLTTSAWIDEDDEVIFSNVLRSSELDGILVFGDLNQRIHTELSKLSTPIVVLDSSRFGQAETAIYVDYENAAYIATRHLIDLGHTDIAYLGNDRMHDFNSLTFGGFQRATTESNLTLHTNRIQLKVYDELSLQRCIDSAFEGKSRPTALFCATDCYAIHAMRYAHTLGIRVPEELSIVGIDDIVFSAYTIPSLTSVRVDKDRICKMGLELLKKKIAGQPCKSETLSLTELMIRESAAAPRTKI